MKKTLIQLIKESNIIIISGGIGTGKSLLMGLIAESKNLLGERFFDWPSQEQLTTGTNVFLDNLEYNEKIKEKREELIRDLQIARHLQQRFFLVISEDSFLLPEISHIGDLHIKVNRCNCNDGWRFIWSKKQPDLHLTFSLFGNSLNYTEKIIRLNDKVFSIYSCYLETINRKFQASLEKSNQRIEQLSQ